MRGQIREIGLGQGRLKTGTPPRLDGRTIDWARLEEQPSDAEHWTMSALDDGDPPAAAALRDHADQRADARNHSRRISIARRLFAGAIEGRGPRYCPSIEDKVKRFADRDAHQIFLEPEGLDDPLVYPNGISTSLAGRRSGASSSAPSPGSSGPRSPGPAMRSNMSTSTRAGSTRRSRSRELPGLFLAGQINGTTGYEEAAAQGLVAGLNAAAHALDLDEVRFDRRTSYIGVMIDDLTLQGVSEPYRMMTARAEYRLSLRADNATTRLGEAALGCRLRLGAATRADRASSRRSRDGRLVRDRGGPG